jgi:hypothetical protein
MLIASVNPSWDLRTRMGGGRRRPPPPAPRPPPPGQPAANAQGLHPGAGTTRRCPPRRTAADFPEGNEREWQRTQPRLSPWRRGSRRLPSWAGSLTDSPRRTTAKSVDVVPGRRRSQDYVVPRQHRSRSREAILFQGTCIHKLPSAGRQLSAGGAPVCAP